MQPRRAWIEPLPHAGPITNRMNHKTLRSLFAFFAIVLFCASTTVSQTQERDMAKESLIWDELKTVAPDRIEDFKAATVAMDSGNYDEAVQLYRAVLKKAPDSHHVLRRLGTSLAMQGKLEEGLSFIEQAIIRNRSADNLYTMALFLTYPAENKEGTPDQKTQAFEIIKEAEFLPDAGDDPDVDLLLAQLAYDFQDMRIFRRVTERLAAKHPALMATHYFKALLAAYDADWSTAETEIMTAQSMGLAPAVAQDFLSQTGIEGRRKTRRYLMYAGSVVGVWLVGLGALFVFGKLMSKRTLRSIEEADPNAGTSSADLGLRKWYRRLIGVAGIYYYLSIPFVIFLVLGAAAAATYFSFVLGHIPIKWLLLLILGALITSYKMIRSLFLKIEQDDPGRPLKVDEAPGLWELTRSVAETVKTRPVDEIRITPGTELAVYERGSWREKSNDQAHRILILGVGVLNGFKLNAFRAVLAHEYGHFSHRDTAGGEIALRVNSDMMKFAYAMILSGQNVWWNLAYHFLRIYDFIFRRLSHGATRLQEVLADRVAATKYGAAAFEEGLRHVIKRGAEFDVSVNKEIASATSRALQNLYELPITAHEEVESMARDSLTRVTSEDDTHPSPLDRFRYIERITSQTEAQISGEVWDLFKDRAGLTTEMTSRVQQELHSYASA